MATKLITTPADVVRVSKLCGISDLEIAYTFGIGSRYLDSKERFAYLDERDPNWLEVYRRKEDDRYYARLKRASQIKTLRKLYEWGSGQDRVENERSSSGPRGDAALKRIIEVFTPRLEQAQKNNPLKEMRLVEKASPRSSDLRKAAIRAICTKVNGQALPIEDDALVLYAQKSGILLGDVLWAFNIPLTLFDKKIAEANTFNSLWWVIENNPNTSANWACAIKEQDFGKQWTKLWGEPKSEERIKMIREIRERLAIQGTKPIVEWFLAFQFVLWGSPAEDEVELACELAEPWITHQSKGRLGDVKNLISQLRNSHPFNGVIKKDRIDRIEKDLFDRVDREKSFVITPDSVRVRRYILEDMDRKRHQRILERILQGIDRKLQYENRPNILHGYIYCLHDVIFGKFRGIHAKKRREMSRMVIGRIYELKLK
ncbi:hypothetical protein KAZ92_03165 [Candidatus Gracilibacteria bacterium]|nr:hypothetical protein [Candidatus Gracilibacteria bacterium]